MAGVFGFSTVPVKRGGGPVAQIGNLLCRRLSIGRVSKKFPSARPCSQPAEHRSAIRQITNLRYGYEVSWFSLGFRASPEFGFHVWRQPVPSEGRAALLHDPRFHFHLARVGIETHSCQSGTKMLVSHIEPG